jgi:hypothetical protein
MDCQSDCIRAQLEKIEENVAVSSSVSAKWQGKLVALEARMLRAEEELSRYRDRSLRRFLSQRYHWFKHR